MKKYNKSLTIASALSKALNEAGEAAGHLAIPVAVCTDHSTIHRLASIRLAWWLIDKETGQPEELWGPYDTLEEAQEAKDESQEGWDNGLQPKCFVILNADCA